MSKENQMDTEIVDEKDPSESGESLNEDETSLQPENSTAQTERITQLEQELNLATQTKDEYYNRLLRLQADFENFRRRSRQEYEQMCLCAGEDLVKKVLPVIDSLERAIECFSGDQSANSWQDGVNLTLKQFHSILASEGLEAVQALNEPFDPAVHEAVIQEESKEVETPTVVALMQKGYKYKNKLLRPALVKVAVPEA